MVEAWRLMAQPFNPLGSCRCRSFRTNTRRSDFTRGDAGALDFAELRAEGRYLTVPTDMMAHSNGD